jgi:hypothetical protein
MSVPSIAIFASLLVLAIVALSADLRADDATGESTTGDHVLGGLFGFFGIGGVPPMLALAVFASTAAISGAALDAIAGLHLQQAYPSWYPAVAAATGLGIGLLCVRLLAATEPPAQAQPMQIHERWVAGAVAVIS